MCIHPVNSQHIERSVKGKYIPSSLEAQKTNISTQSNFTIKDMKKQRIKRKEEKLTEFKFDVILKMYITRIILLKHAQPK